MVSDFISEFTRYRAIGEKALAQIVLLARKDADENLEWISFAKNKSGDYNANPDSERGFK